MRELIAKDQHNQECVFPYVGGEEVNDSPDQSTSRYIINFGAKTEQEARCWPDLMAIVESKVKPSRLTLKRQHLREQCSGLERALAGGPSRRHRTAARRIRSLEFSRLARA